MLKKLDLNVKIENAQWNELADGLKTRLGMLQQFIRDMKIPVVIVFEGWGASGKGSMISRLISNLDPRGFSVYSIDLPTPEEQRYPWMRRFWQKLPTYGDIAIFDRSWYRGVSIPEQELSKKEIERRLDEISDFEQQLIDDGYVLLKFFLHISQKEQKKRFKLLEGKKTTSWRVNDADWRQNEHYDDCLTAFENLLTRTDSYNKRWTVVEATDKHYAAKKVFETVIRALEEKIAQKGQQDFSAFTGIRSCEDIQTLPIPLLKDIKLDKTLEEDEYKHKLKSCQKRLFDLHNCIYQQKIPVILVYEGWDAAGKGGNIKRISQALDARGYEVIPIAAPSMLERNHHYLWRFWNALPKDGHIAVFDRSWYGRVMVEHIEGLCTDEQWGRAYDEINRFERSLADWGAIILKFWLHIDKDEQLKRFTERQNTLEKQYKITEEDWRNRDRWDDYEKAVNEMLVRTNTAYAPWIIVESNDKHYARIKTMRAVIDAIERRL
ncbi:polyphosphate:AMP phosphotransferase [Oscillospiraceae bacterium PP1C4]